MKHFDHIKLDQKMREVLSQKGVNEESLSHCVSSLIQTSLRGVDSHGINLFPHYSRAVDSGRINKNPEFRFNHTASGTGILDADHAFGHHSGAHAINKAIELAGQNGISAISVINSSHFGAAAYFALMAAEKGMLGFSFTNADALVKASGAKKAFFGTNPICFTAPLKNEEPLCLDMATSLVSWNKVMNKRRTDEMIPPHWAYDNDGKSTENPHEARSLSPIGDYKGFGLGFMVDVLCAVLAGGLISKDILPMYNSPIEARRRVGHFFMAIDISKFSELESFCDYLQNTVDRIRQMEALPGEKVMVPGDPEKKFEKERLITGIPVDDVKFEEFLVVDSGFHNCLKN
jgi:ureidoglycolate dehydrogenase (NAD+)